MKNNKLLLFGVFLISQFVAFGQREIKGKIRTEEENQPAIGVRIQIKGTLIGTVTDENGDYSISVTSEKDTLIFKLIDYL